MSKASYKKFSGDKISPVISRGKVNELIRKYDKNKNILPRTRSEQSLVTENNNKNIHFHKSTENLTNSSHGPTSSVSTKKGQKNVPSQRSRQNEQDTISEKLEKEYTTVDLPIQNVEINTGAIPKVISTLKKRPVPAPRVSIIPRNKPAIENKKKLQTRLQDIEPILNIPFTDDAESGTIDENARKSLISLLDDHISEMKSEGYDDNIGVTVVNDNEKSSEESDYGNKIDELYLGQNQEYLSDGDDGKEDFVEYVNLDELLYSKLHIAGYEVEKSNDIENQLNVTKRYPTCGNINDFSKLQLKSADSTGQDEEYLSDRDDENDDGLIYANVAELRYSNPNNCDDAITECDNIGQDKEYLSDGDDEYDDGLIYANVAELLHSNLNNVEEYDNIKQHTDITEKYPICENIDDIKYQSNFSKLQLKSTGSTGQDKEYLSDGDDEYDDGPIYVDVAELLHSNLNDFGEAVEECNSIKKHTDITEKYPFYKNIDDDVKNAFVSQLNFDESQIKGTSNSAKGRVDWNIPPEINRTLKPTYSFNKTKKNIACSLNYEESDVENYKGTIINRRSGQKIEDRKSLKNQTREGNNSSVNENSIINKIIQEFKETEKRYLQELTEIIPLCKFGIKNNPAPKIRSKAELICKTIDKLLEFQTEFANIIKTSNDSLENILQIFIEYEILFITYKQCLLANNSGAFSIRYSEGDFDKEINLPSMLNQRLFHYKMFLERIRDKMARPKDLPLIHIVLCPLNTIEEIIRSCDINLHLARVENVPLNNENQDILVNSARDGEKDPPSPLVQYCPFDVKDYGDFLLKDNFKISKPFTTSATVFLFNNIILFAVEYQTDKYYYHSHIKTNSVRLLPENKKQKDVLAFEHCTSMSKQYIRYKLRAQSSNIAKTWRNKIISDCLWTQELSLREEVTRHYSRRIRFSLNRSKFHYH